MNYNFTTMTPHFSTTTKTPAPLLKAPSPWTFQKHKIDF